MAAQVPPEGLTSVEQSLVEHVCSGEPLDLIPDIPRGEAIDEATMRSWSDSQTCSATVIRDILRGRLAADPDPHGLRLRGARITGRLDLEYLTTDVSLELTDCLIERGVVARDASLPSVSLARCQLKHPAVQPPLYADGLTCRVLDLRKAKFIGRGDDGAIRLVGAQIGDGLYCDGASLRNDSGPALFGDALRVGQSMFLSGGFTATGSGEKGAVRLIGAHIGLSLYCTGATLHNDSGPALLADGLEVSGAIVLRGEFIATGSGEHGTVRLVGARIGQFSCGGATLHNDSGPALLADGLEVDQDMSLAQGFTATGHGSGGTVRLSGACIGGQLDCTGAALSNDSGPALFAASLQVDQDMFVRGEFIATGGGTRAVVDLKAARVGGMFQYAPKQLEHKTDPHRLLEVDGLTYTGVPGRISPEDWRELLRRGTRSYAAQPYQQLAAGYRTLGDDRQARKTLMAQRDDQLSRTDPHWSERLWGKITRVTLGYGYQPWRALWFLAAVVAVSCVLAVVLGAHGALAQTSKTTAPGRPCTVVQKVSVGLDLNLPVGTTVARAGCDLTKDAASVTGAWLSVGGWVLRLLAWVFAALFIAGFTSAVRKT